MSERPPCKQLFLLVGSNPLPNFLAAIILKPESVCLFYTPETAPVKNRLKDALQKRSHGWKITEQPITDAADPINIQESVRKKLTNETHLHYTGGTKTMAAHALMAFHDAGGTDDQASYLDEKKGILRFDDENVTPIYLSKENLGLTIREILGLHGINVESIGSEQKPDSDLPTAKDAEIIATNVIKEPALARKLYEHFRDKDGNHLNVTEAKKDKLCLHEYFPGLSINEYPLEKWNSEKYKKVENIF